jgi:hypothetical protein
MSTGQWIGAILGFIVGFVVSGFNPYWGIYGAIIGYTIGGYIDPVKPDVKQPGAPAPLGLQVMTNIIGNPIFDVLGIRFLTCWEQQRLRGNFYFLGKSLIEQSGIDRQKGFELSAAINIMPPGHWEFV